MPAAAVQSAVVQPAALLPAALQSTATQSVQPAAVQPAATQSAAAQSAAVQSAAVQSATVRSAADQSAVGKSHNDIFTVASSSLQIEARRTRSCRRGRSVHTRQGHEDSSSVQFEVAWQRAEKTAIPASRACTPAAPPAVSERTPAVNGPPAKPALGVHWAACLAAATTIAAAARARLARLLSSRRARARALRCRTACQVSPSVLTPARAASTIAATTRACFARKRLAPTGAQ